MTTLPTLKSIKDIPEIENLGVEIEFEPQDEDMQPDFEDEEYVKRIEKEYSNGNMAAWFCAHVTVRYRGLENDDYLGGCSYNSFKEFTEMDNDYYLDMVNTTIERINSEIKAINFEIQKRWDIRKAKNMIAPYNLYIVSSNILETV